jgi:hypothetical protein
MSFKSFFVSCRGAPQARAVGFAARVHALVSAPVAGAGVRNPGAPRVRQARTVALRHLTRAAALVVRNALHVAWTGRPLTPGGYAILALTVTGVLLAALITASPAGDELDSALPLSWWFA